MPLQSGESRRDTQTGLAANNAKVPATRQTRRRQDDFRPNHSRIVPTMSPALTLCVSGEDGSSHLRSAIRSPTSSKLGSKINGRSATVRQVRITSVLDELEASQEECLALRDQVDTQAALTKLRSMYYAKLPLDSASAQMVRLGGTSPCSAPPPLIAVQSTRLSIPTPALIRGETRAARR